MYQLQRRAFWGGSAFDKIKHNRHGYFSDANQESVFNILSVLYFLGMTQFGKVAKENGDHLEESDSPDESSEVFALLGWNYWYTRVGEFFDVIDGQFYQIDDGE